MTINMFIVGGIVSMVSGITCVIGKFRISNNHQFWFRFYEDRFGKEVGRRYSIVGGILTFIFGLSLLLIGLINTHPYGILKLF